MSRATPSDVALLLAGLRSQLTLDEARWERLLRIGRMTGLHARLAAANLDNPTLTPPVRRHLLSSARVAAFRSQMVRAELAHLAPLCQGDFPVIALKGSAYVLQGQAMAEGRFVSDVDLLVPQPHLRAMEERLLAAGWRATELDPYDERYYRDWSHEVPPMRFPGHTLEVDLHHAITPVTGTLNFDPGVLFEDSEAIAGTPFRVLRAEDQVLHACLHCFHDGELDMRLREVVDIDGLLRSFGPRAGFWPQLVQRAAQLGLERPLWYGLHFAQAWLDCPIPSTVLPALPAPSRLTRDTMDALVPLAMFPADPDYPAPRRVKLARTLMQVRYHLLRMPPHLLAPHLARKSLRRLQARFKPGSGAATDPAP